jgi:hypothetical protein
MIAPGGTGGGDKGAGLRIVAAEAAASSETLSMGAGTPKGGATEAVAASPVPKKARGNIRLASAAFGTCIAVAEVIPAGLRPSRGLRLDASAKGGGTMKLACGGGTDADDEDDDDDEEEEDGNDAVDGAGANAIS